MKFEYDVVVIGAGSGGVRLSRLLAAAGKRVALAENQEIGGTCVVRGCVPKKLLAYAAGYQSDAKDAAGYGLTWEVSRFSWTELKTRIQREVARLSNLYREMLVRSGVVLFEGYGRIVSEHEVAIGARRLSAQYIVVATGSSPGIPDIPGADHALTSTDVFTLDRLPKRLAIVGGGYIATELASILNVLGTSVDVIYRGSTVLRGFDDDLRKLITDELGRRGISIIAHQKVESLRRDGEHIVATLAVSDEQKYDAVLFATGRLPNTQELGLEAMGVRLTESGAIDVDSNFASSVPSIYAIGDVNGRMQLTPVATREAEILAAKITGTVSGRTIDYEIVPSAVFTNPEIATVGLPEHVARTRYEKLDVYRTTFKSMRHVLSGRDERTFMKLVVDRPSRRILGAHMMGRDAAEIMQGIAIAVSMGATKEDFDRTVGIHPTSAEEFVTLRAASLD